MSYNALTFFLRKINLSIIHLHRRTN